MKTEQSKLLFVYNANSTLFAQVTDFFHKAVSPSTYQCNLCRITYGNVGMKKQWQEFIQSLALPVQFFHKDELKQNQPELASVELPAVFIVNEGKPRLLINSFEIDGVHSIDSLIKLVETKLRQIKEMNL